MKKVSACIWNLFMLFTLGFNVNVLVEAEVEAILSEIDPFEQPFKKRVEENQLDDIDTRFLVATEVSATFVA